MVVIPVGMLCMDSLSYTLVIEILVSFGGVLVCDSFSLSLLSIRFQLKNSLLVYIFYMGV